MFNNLINEFVRELNIKMNRNIINKREGEIKVLDEHKMLLL